MNLQQLETFRAVVSLGSFTEAAKILNSTQSTVSMRISDLEQELGVQLLDRTHRGIRPTLMGKKLLPYARKICDLRYEIVSEIGPNRNLSSIIRLGSGEIAASTWLPKLLKKINEHYPNVDVDLEVGLTRDSYQKILNGESDILFYATDESCPDGLVLNPLYELEYRYLASPSLKIHERKLQASELRSYRLISLGSTSVLSSIEDKLWRRQLIKPSNRMRSNSMEVSAKLAGMGLGVSLLPVPLYCREIAEGRLVMLETECDPLRVQFSAIHSHARVSPLVHIVLDWARELALAPGLSKT